MEFYGIEKISLVDFDKKICATLFTKGCNFACPFCHNSELVINKQEIKPISFKEILDFLKQRQGFLDAVCITGGEPTLMCDLKEKILAIRNLGYEIKLDTNGSNPKVLADLLSSGFLNYVAMDIKNCFAKYDITTGSKVNIEQIKESISLLINGHVEYEFRTTLVAQYFTADEDIIALGKQIKGAKKLLLQHFIASENCIQSGLHEVELKKAQHYVELLKPYVKEVGLRGY